MKFIAGKYGQRRDVPETVYLSHTGWDDWFKYSTLYHVDYVDAEGEEHSIGATKIGRVGLLPARAATEVPEGARYPRPPRSFRILPDGFFSLGQDIEFYEALGAISDDFREEVLKGLKDIAYDADLREIAENEDVTRVSLLRSVPLPTVRDQFHRLARGGARLTSFDLRFKLNYTKSVPVPSMKIAVEPGALPPTNIHVVIGRNGVGKSTFLNNLAKYLVAKANNSHASDFDSSASAQISNLVSVSFSAFDQFEPLSVPEDRSGLTYHYVGLKKKRRRADDPEAIKGPKALATEMAHASRLCFVGARRARWLRGLRLLESDPIFAAAGIADTVESSEDFEDVQEHISALFRRLSSGHKIVLLTITKLVETVEEKSLVLLDEPEAHLHPPLLSAFVRALSDLLINRNGVAVVATHSPVVLQEVPSRCAWKIDRVGDNTTVSSPLIETFGENVGTLTNEVFGLEVSATGFHRMLADAVQQHGNYQDALDSFDGQVGTEGKAILRAMANIVGQANVGR